ncbi:YqjF family protein [Rubricoccus marinus]|uniref:DUF2071 domain-containing protein n=1 Tax=Rubricoccus marinus TaxID=716817 RepID=A0A259TVU5_9BACT|nr:DUF2071 domain-containing protein [Rubricoccus marinus]OZC01826.1 hypothetical protein BSZ36_01770 [Rubricoccus marinus]
MSRPFLTARWESLLLLNYAVPPEALLPRVPAGTALDLWRGEALVSVVGFMMRDTRVLGVPVPFHRTFEEVNLRFYVTRTTPEGEVRRAVVFVRELVPKRAIATVARVAYNEPYSAVPMSHAIALTPEAGGSVTYGWRDGGREFALRGVASGAAAQSEPGTESEFITEHYWGYTRQRDGGTLEYQVEHPKWDTWALDEATLTGDTSALYGPEFAGVLAGPPRSAFLAVGSEVAVHKGRRIA